VVIPVSPRPDPDVVRILREFRLALDLKETAIIEQMAARWLEIERRLDAEILLLAQEIERRAATGEAVTQQIVWRSERYKILRAQMEQEIMRYNRDYAARMIAERQAEYATLGIDAAQQSISASYGPLGGTFTRINVSAVSSIIGLAGDGSPLYKLLKESYPDAVDGLVKALINGIAMGKGSSATARDMANGMGMGLERAMLIARTETARAYRTANVQQYRESGVVIGFKRLVKKETACMACLMSDGEKFDMAEELSDHPRGKAEIPGNIIDCSSPTAFITLNYNGDVVVIRTASGKLLTVTPNHPVLTTRGWVSAKFIKKGDNVVSTGWGDRASGVMRPDKNHVPTTVENIPSSFNMFRLGSVPRSTKNLNGNGGIGDGDIDVVFANRLLWNGFDPSYRKHMIEFFFGSRNVGSIPFNASGNTAKMFIREFLTACIFLGLQHNEFSFGFSHFGKSENGGGFSTPSLDTVFGKNSSYNVPANIKLSGNGKFGFPGGVQGTNISRWQDDLIPADGGKFTRLNDRTFGFTPEQPIGLEIIRQSLWGGVPPAGRDLGAIASNIVLDGVVEIGIRTYSGHVYSLQTQEEWYISNGIISHNCVAVPYLKDVPSPRWQTGPEWFVNLNPEQQIARMGPEKFALWKDGQIKLADLSKRTRSDVWGDSPRVATIKELIGK